VLISSDCFYFEQLRNTYNWLMCMRSHCTSWNVLFFFPSVLFDSIFFSHLFHNLGWITKGHAFLKAHMLHPCVLLRIQGETEGPKSLSIHTSHTSLHIPYTLILTPLATIGLLKSENVLPLSVIYIIVWWGMIPPPIP